MARKVVNDFPVIEKTIDMQLQTDACMPTKPTPPFLSMPLLPA